MQRKVSSTAAAKPAGRRPAPSATDAQAATGLPADGAAQAPLLAQHRNRAVRTDIERALEPGAGSVETPARDESAPGLAGFSETPQSAPGGDGMAPHLREK